MSSQSARSKRIRDEARNRPDKVWLHNNEWMSKKYVKPAVSISIMSGGTELAQLIAESDAHLAAMRKIVR